MAEDLTDHLALRDDGDEPQCPTLTPREVCHIQRKDPMQQPCPAPRRRRGARLWLVEALLPWCREDRPTQMAVGRQAAPIAHEMHVRQGHEGRQLLQEFQWREANPRGAIGPWMGERVDEIAVGVLDQAFERDRTAGGIADELFQPVPPVRWDRGVRVQGKAVHAGTARTGEPW